MTRGTIENLRKTAEAEADNAEAELRLEDRDSSPDEGAEDAAPTNGKADGFDPFGRMAPKPEAEEAAADGAPDPDRYTPRPPTADELERAREVWAQIQGRCQDWTSEQTVESLVSIVDVHPSLTAPDEWQGEEDDEYREADCVREIASVLLRGCRTLAISPRKVTCLWRNKAKWTRAGKTVHATVIPFGKRTQFLTDGVLAALEVNFHDFKTLNPLQKVFAVYHALAAIDAEGGRIPPDFEGYRHELEVFGVRVFRDHVSMTNAVRHGMGRELAYQLSLLDADWGEES